jgi:hypothetical protein
MGTYSKIKIELTKMTAAWDIAPRSLVQVDRRFGGAYALTQHYVPEGCHLHTHCNENLKSLKRRYNIKQINLRERLMMVMIMSMGRDYVSELQPPMGILFIPR